MIYKVSVIIPVYGVENYVVRCAESLFNQTLDAIQYIFVDDASPDNSIVLLEQTIERFPQRKPHTIILRHQKNLGLPTAHATGLAHVTAPYVAHCDSDDYVEHTMYAQLYDYAIQNNSDMVICGYISHCVDGREIPSSCNPIPSCSLIHNFLYERLCPCVWCRLTKTDIYRKIIFPKENFFEDWVQTAQLLTYSKQIFFLDSHLYHYNQRPMSITTNIQIDLLEEKMRQRIDNYTLMHDFIVKHHQVREKDFSYKKQRVRSLYLLQTNQWELRKKYMHAFPEINFNLLFNRRVPMRHKFYHLFVLLGLHLVANSVYNAFQKYIVYKNHGLLKASK